MKRRFTILTAALALLAFLAIPMGMWGQTRTTQTASYGFETGDAGWTATNFVTNNTAITAHGGSIYGATNGSSTANVKYNAQVATPVSLTCYYSKTTTNTNAGSHFEIQVSTNNSTWTKVAEGNGMNNVDKGTWYELSADLSSYSNVYVRVYYTGTSAVRALDDITLTYDEGSTPTTYTVTFDAGDGNFVGNTDFPNTSNTVSPGTYTLPSAERSGYTFDGWVTGNNNPITGSYTVSGNVDFTASYTQNSSGTITATITKAKLGLTGTSYSSGDKTIDGITYTYADLMPSNDNIQAKASTGTIKNSTPYSGDIISVVITHSGTARATTINGSADGTNWTQVATGSGSITADFSGRGYKYFQITRGSNAAYWEKIDITYSTSSSSLTDSDLAITNASTALSFDLYNNSTAQTITYTTSSTGAITITPASPTEYFSYVHDATAKTITVTPTAVTPSAQTVTISQEADDDYYAGTATFTVSVANSDPNVPGTVNNPYTVAQAIANTPSNGNVYIQGIVSSFYNTSIVGDGTNYRYYISDDGGTTTQLLVYKGKGLNQVAFSNVNDLLVGDEVVIYGSLITYNNAPEVASGNYLYSWNRPVAAVEAPTFSPAAGTFTTAQTVTLSCATTGATIYYTLDGTEPTDSSTEYTNAIAVSTTTTIKAIAYVGSEASTVATATYHINSQDNPYTVAQALAFNEYPANGIYVHGIVSTAPTSLSSGTLTYYISVDGTATNELEVYKGKDMGNENFTAVNDIQVGDIVTIYGNVVIYNNTKEFAQGNYLVSFERPAQQYTLTVNCSANVDIFTFVDPNEQGVEGPTTQQVTSGTEVGISVSATTGYILTLMVDGTDVTSQLDNSGYYSFYMPTHNVIVTATASAAPVVTTNTYTLATSIESGKQYIIVGWADGTPYAMGYDKGNNRHAVEISVTGDDNETASATIANTETNPHEFTITSLATAGFYSIQDATASGYLYAAGSSKNYLKTETTLDENHNGDWEISIDSETGVASVIASNSSNRNVMQFNHGDKLFACYATASQHSVFLYVKDETPVTETFPKPIVGWNNYDNPDASGWYLIATPIGEVAPCNVANMIAEPPANYDLFIFDQTQQNEWQNFKQGHFSNLEPGKGYLYANSSDVTLTFTGSAYTGTGTFPLVYSDDENQNPDSFMHGWNLVGNPFAEKATVSRPFYTLDEETFEYAAVNEGTVESMEGIFVHVTAAEYEQNHTQTVTFTPISQQQSGEGKGSSLTLNVNKGGKFVDRAIISFSQGGTLPKFQFDRNHTKVYIQQDGQDYAIVNSEEMGAMPVNFKAENDGTYSLSFSSRNAEFAYLHLIDNMTGKDIDLLQTPSYSFEAKTTDYESRFKLVFATGDNSKEDNFAFFSNGSFVINNEGNATLQVIDIMGRIIKSESINGCTNVNVNAAPGVYMLRLVNGENVKVQKVVVE